MSNRSIDVIYTDLIYCREYEKFKEWPIVYVDEYLVNVKSFQELEYVKSLIHPKSKIILNSCSTMILVQKDFNKVKELYKEGYKLILREEANQIIDIIKDDLDMFFIKGYYPCETVYVRSKDLVHVDKVPSYPYRYTMVTDNINYKIVDLSGRLVVTWEAVVNLGR